MSDFMIVDDPWPKSRGFHGRERRRKAARDMRLWERALALYKKVCPEGVAVEPGGKVIRGWDRAVKGGDKSAEIRMKFEDGRYTVLSQTVDKDAAWKELDDAVVKEMIRREDEALKTHFKWKPHMDMAYDHSGSPSRPKR